MRDLGRGSTWALVGGTLAGSFLAKIAFIAFQKTYLTVEPFEYEEAARYLVSGEGLKNIYLNVPYSALVHPFYPALCSLIYRMHGDHLAVLVVQTAAATLLGLFVYLMGTRLFSPAVAWLACVLTLFHPGLWVYTTLKLHSLIFDAAWCVVVLLLVLKLEESLSIRRAVLTGVLGGLASLARSPLALLVLFGTSWVVWRARRKVSFASLAMSAATTVVVAFLVVAPWLLRNEQRLGHRAGVVSTFGLNLWLGNNPIASGSAYTADGRSILDVMPEEMRQRLSGLTEWEQNDLFKEEALRFMTANPMQTVTGMLKKWLAFWWRSPQSGLLYPERWKRLYSIYYLVLLGLMLWAGSHAILVGNERLRASVSLILLSFFLLSIAQSVLYVEGRHRWVVEPVLLIFSAEGARLLWVRVRGGVRSHSSKVPLPAEHRLTSERSPQA